MTEKKIFELHLLNNFIANSNMEVTSIIDDEPPDFIIEIENKKISVELTRLINPNIKEVEKYKERVVKQVEKRFLDKYDVELYVLIKFTDVILHRKKETQYTDYLFTTIERVYLTNKDLKFDIHYESHGEVDFVSTIDVGNVLEFHNWQSFGAFLVDYVEAGWFRTRIAEKEGNIKDYKTPFDENWLLMVSHLGTKASAIRFENMDFQNINSSFEKIYIYKYKENQIIEVK